jgi:hypothetical protein
MSQYKYTDISSKVAQAGTLMIYILEVPGSYLAGTLAILRGF